MESYQKFEDNFPFLWIISVEHIAISLCVWYDFCTSKFGHCSINRTAFVPVFLTHLIFEAFQPQISILMKIKYHFKEVCLCKTNKLLPLWKPAEPFGTI